VHADGWQVPCAKSLKKAGGPEASSPSKSTSASCSVLAAPLLLCAVSPTEGGGSCRMGACSTLKSSP